MDLVGPLEIVLGAALFFFVPGFTVSRAVFPERRLRGAAGLRGAVELVVLAFVLSVGLTVVVGFVLLRAAPGGFSASWGAPTLEVALAAIALVALGVGAVQGAYARVPPAPRAPETGGGEEGAWELSRELDRLRAERKAAGAQDAGAAPSPDGAERRAGKAREELYER